LFKSILKPEQGIKICFYSWAEAEWVYFDEKGEPREFVAPTHWMLPSAVSYHLDAARSRENEKDMPEEYGPDTSAPHSANPMHPTEIPQALAALRNDASDRLCLHQNAYRKALPLAEAQQTLLREAQETLAFYADRKSYLCPMIETTTPDANGLYHGKPTNVEPIARDKFGERARVMLARLDAATKEGMES
jgi:hypothetical protein